ncbi:DoxX family membrane protein [Actinomycetospora sp. CA-084318]|uniref:DoxX family membrane protein n=1 Tax=Actinomycetospora sp. CA-084318 TaxID=3239892 RepID=UPI003D958BD5
MSLWRRERVEGGDVAFLGFEGAPSDTAVFPWREERGASTIDEPVPTTTVLAVRPWSIEVGLLVARVVLGVTAVLGGARTLFDLPRGHGDGTAHTQVLLSGYGFAPAAGLGTALGWVQLVAGVLVTVGVFASFAGSALLAIALVALVVTLPAAWASGTVGPAETSLFAVALAVVVVLAGPGRISGDADRPWHRGQTAVGITCAVLAVGTALTVLLAMRA